MSRLKITRNRHCEESSTKQSPVQGTEAEKEIASSKTPRNDGKQVFRHILNPKLFQSAIFTILLTIINPTAYTQVKPGIDALISQNFDILKGKRVGLITNPTGVTADLRSTIDVLMAAKDVELVALFGPEHGVRGNIFAGKKIGTFTDEKTGVPVYSLYGKTRQPMPRMLENVDVLIYDIQDIGSRAYTYIYTMALSMQAAAAQKIPFVVLDRPNPLGAELIEGPVLEKKFSSFIGLYPIPYIYGMTVGELAKYFNAEFDFGAELTVVPMAGYRRDMQFADTGLQWVATSPHIPQARTAWFCATTGILGELQKVSEGVGYTQPFEMVCQTWIDPSEFADELNGHKLPGVYFRPCYIRPYYFTLKGQELGGVQIHIQDYDLFSPMLAQLHILQALLKLYPQARIFDTDRISSFDRAMGTDKVRLALLRGESPEKIIASWQPALLRFKTKRSKYLIY